MTHKKVLLLYNYHHHHAMVERLASSMGDFGVGIDVLCMDNLHLVNKTGVNYCLGTRLGLALFKKYKSGLLYRVLRKLFVKGMLKSMLRHYDLVDFHAYVLDYLSYMRFCKEQGIPFDITPWGSDIMRANDETLEKKRFGFENCRYIKCTENLQQLLAEKYTDVFDNKMKTVYWGNSDYEVIDKTDSAAVLEFRKSILDNGEEILVTCGYNGSEGQNHEGIIAALKGLPEEMKSKTCFLFPLTYGALPEYVAKVTDALKNADVHYKVIDKYISGEDIAKLRLASDVVVNMQRTDAFSGSLQDHLYCNNVLIIAEWLNYVPLDYAGVFYIKTSFEALGEQLLEVLSDLGVYKKWCEGNHKKMKNLTSWQTVLLRWSETYISD